MKSIGTAICVVPRCPDFKPPSPENPSRPLRVSEELGDRFLIGVWKIILLKMGIATSGFALLAMTWNVDVRSKNDTGQKESGDDYVPI